DGGDLAAYISDLQGAGSHRHAVYMHSASAAHRDSTAIFRARDPELVSQDPKERHVVFDIYIVSLPVDLQAHWPLRERSWIGRRSADDHAGSLAMLTHTPMVRRSRVHLLNCRPTLHHQKSQLLWRQLRL